MKYTSMNDFILAIFPLLFACDPLGSINNRSIIPTSSLLVAGLLRNGNLEFSWYRKQTNSKQEKPEEVDISLLKLADWNSRGIEE